MLIKGSDPVTGWRPHADRPNVFVHDDFPTVRFIPILFGDGKRLELIGDWGGLVPETIEKTSGSARNWKGQKGRTADDMVEDF